MALLLHVYDPFDRPADQVLTWEALSHWAGSPFATVAHSRTMGHLGYAKALQANWHYKDDIVVVEQDIVPSFRQVVDLLTCGAAFCAFDYNLSHGVPWTLCEGGTGLGLSKLSKRARLLVTATPAVPRCGHRDMPGVLAERLPAVHVHRPLAEHHHGLA